MTLRLSVDAPAWRAHVGSVASALGDVLPVVKGNGYGFGRSVLLSHATTLSRDIAVGSAHELDDVPADVRPFVLTPVGVGVEAIKRRDAVLAVGSQRDLEVLAALDAKNPVVIKVESSMHRYGTPAAEAAGLRKRAEAAGHVVVAWSAHLSLSGTDADHAAEAVSIATSLATDLPFHVSHVHGAVETLREAIKHRVVVRTGTHLWLGDKSMLALHADVIAVRYAVSDTAGYRASAVPRGARLVMVGCGSSHGVGALPDGTSPFHFDKRRLHMLEAPHMHTTMLAVTDDPCPTEGDWVDVQQPMTRVVPDVTVWN